MPIGRERRATSQVLTWIVLCLTTVVVAGVAPRSAAQAAGMRHTLTLADNGTTIAVPLGDFVELRLDVNLNWTVSVSDPNVLRRPPGIALIREVQGYWGAVAFGSATITASGDAPCRLSVPACTVPSLLFTATVNVVGSPPGPPSGGGSASYPAGWNIVGVPDGTTLPLDAWSWEPRRGEYARVPAGAALAAGRGYWVYFPTPQTVALAAGGRTTVALDAPAGAWVLIGDPSATSGATISGADTSYSYDPIAGAYTLTRTLGPGGGAWALSLGGGRIVISAQPPAPPNSAVLGATETEPSATRTRATAW